MRHEKRQLSFSSVFSDRLNALFKGNFQGKKERFVCKLSCLSDFHDFFSQTAEVIDGPEFTPWGATQKAKAHY